MKLVFTPYSSCCCSCNTYCSKYCKKQHNYDESYNSGAATSTTNAKEKQSNNHKQEQMKIIKFISPTIIGDNAHDVHTNIFWLNLNKSNNKSNDNNNNNNNVNIIYE